VVSTNVLSPKVAVLGAAFFNFVAFLMFGLSVAQTMGTGIVSEEAMDAIVLFAALFGVIAWDGITWWARLPSSSSHAISPLVGLVLAMLGMVVLSWTVMKQNPFEVDRVFRTLQFCSASLYSLGHGGNDAQTTMGIITALLFTQGYLSGGFHVPLWVVLSCHAAMAVGTLIGGWRIVRTIGSRITHIKPAQVFCAGIGWCAHRIHGYRIREPRFQRRTPLRARLQASVWHARLIGATGRRGRDHFCVGVDAASRRYHGRHCVFSDELGHARLRRSSVPFVRLASGCPSDRLVT